MKKLILSITLLITTFVVVKAVVDEVTIPATTEFTDEQLKQIAEHAEHAGKQAQDLTGGGAFSLIPAFADELALTCTVNTNTGPVTSSIRAWSKDGHCPNGRIIIDKRGMLKCEKGAWVGKNKRAEDQEE